MPKSELRLDNLPQEPINIILRYSIDNINDMKNIAHVNKFFYKSASNLKNTPFGQLIKRYESYRKQLKNFIEINKDVEKQGEKEIYYREKQCFNIDFAVKKIIFPFCVASVIVIAACLAVNEIKDPTLWGFLFAALAFSILGTYCFHRVARPWLNDIYNDQKSEYENEPLSLQNQNILANPAGKIGLKINSSNSSEMNMPKKNGDLPVFFKNQSEKLEEAITGLGKDIAYSRGS